MLVVINWVTEHTSRYIILGQTVPLPTEDPVTGFPRLRQNGAFYLKSIYYCLPPPRTPAACMRPRLSSMAVVAHRVPSAG